MKYPFASRFVLIATIATSTIHRGIAVPCPGLASLAIQHRRKINDDSESSSTELHVENEGNLYSSSSTLTSTSTSKMATASTKRRAFNQLRGGEIFVDNEGILHTPRKVLPSSPKRVAAAISAPPKEVSSPMESLRGGSKNNDIGGLSVDPEGNFYATATPSCAGSGALFSLRGGSLCVDREGNFYSSRNPEVQQGPVGNRRRNSSGNSAGPVLLAKNRLPKKTSASGSGSKPKKPSASCSNPMAFIGYNNALMET